MEKNKATLPKLITFHAISTARQKGVLRIGQIFLPCAIGKSGRTYRKREGDLASPKGKWRLGSFLYRADRANRPISHLKGQKIKQKDIWCDDTKSALYNRKTQKPFKGSAEDLWRDDAQYDLLVIIKYNMSPIIRHKGSAIFIHVIKGPSYPPTAGCLAFKRSDLNKLLRLIGPNTSIMI